MAEKDPLKKLEKLSNTVGVSVGVILSQQFSSWIQQSQKHQTSIWVTTFSALIIVAISTEIIKLFFENIFESFKELRKLLLGRYFLEGTWIDIIFDNDKPISIGVSRFEFRNGSLHYGGEDFGLNDSISGHPFRDDMLVLNWPIIKYKYTSHRSDNNLLSNQGYGELQVIERDGIPCRHVGFFFDFVLNKKFTFLSTKIEDKKILQMLFQPELRRKTVQDFWESKGFKL